MFNRPQTLEISTADLEVIEAALHTQSQILDVQASAGGTEARERLNAVKRLLVSLSSRKPLASDTAPAHPRRLGGLFHWLGRSCPGC